MGSNGSAIILFKDQIASGGPVTVTHPDIIRYAIQIILGYEDLNNLSCEKVEENKDRLKEIIRELNDYYKPIREEKNKQEVRGDISPTLISQILLGTLACMPAYDSVLPLCLQKMGIKPKSFSINSICRVATDFKEFFKDNNDMEIKNESEDLKYPEMKIIDMCCWWKGKD